MSWVTSAPLGCPGWRRSGHAGGPGWGAQHPQEEQPCCSCCPMDGGSWRRGTPGLSQSEGRLMLWLWCRDGEVPQRKEGAACISTAPVGGHGAGPQPWPGDSGDRLGCPQSPPAPAAIASHMEPAQFGCTGNVAPQDAAPTHPCLPLAHPTCPPSPTKPHPPRQMSHLPAFPAPFPPHTPHWCPALPGCCALCTDINGLGKKIL